MGLRSGKACVVWGVVLLALVGPSSAWGQFGPPRPVSPAGSSYGNAHLGRDSLSNFSFVFDDGMDIFFASTLGNGMPVNVTSNALANANARIAPAPLGVFYIVYEEEGTEPGSVGNDIVLIDNEGGPFTNPEKVTTTAEAELDPDIALANSGTLFIVFTRVPAVGPSEVMLSIDGNTPQPISQGDQPRVVTSQDGAAHIAYRRSGDLFYRRYVDGQLEAEVPLATLGGTEQSLNLAVDSNLIVHAAFEGSSGFPFYTHNASGPFSTPLLIETLMVSGGIDITANGASVAVVFASGGRIYADSLTQPAVVVTPGSTNAQNPQVQYDGQGYIHVSYEEDGTVYYTNTVPPPTADFSADVTNGEVPLSVQFENLATGVFNHVLWDFGDGTTSSTFAPQHVYNSIGSHTVSLTVSGPGGEASETKADYVVTAAPTHILEVPAIVGFAAEQDVYHPILGTNQSPVEAFQLAVAFDGTRIQLHEVTLQNTVTNTLAPEFVVADMNIDGADSYFTLAVLIDFDIPHDGRTISPGEKRIFANMHYDISATAPLGAISPIELRNSELGSPPINNIFTIDGLSKLPFLISGGVQIGLPQVTFLRSDADASGDIALLDAIFLLDFIFNAGDAPRCPDAADFDDGGSLGLIDALGILNFIFAQGPPPSYPYPGFGVDPTEDTLGPCQ